MYPDFRTNERALQLITQVAGRAGRAQKTGEVFVQTSQPEHPILMNVIAGEYTSFYERELLQRDQFKYPPFYRLIEVKLTHKKEELVQLASYTLQEALKKTLGPRSMGVSIPPVARVRSQYIRMILVKLMRERDDIKAVKIYLQQAIDTLVFQAEFKQVSIRVNVDPG
jgi:primosomal protein N' (replication factor Y)